MRNDGFLLDRVLPWTPDLRTIHLTQLYGRHAHSILQQQRLVLSRTGSLHNIRTLDIGTRRGEMKGRVAVGMIMSVPGCMVVCDSR